MRDALIQNIATAQEALDAANAALSAFDSSADNNRFETLEEAAAVLEDKLRDLAFQDCEGAGNCGLDKYTRGFMVGDVGYLGTLKVEYDRHDKTYYYIEEARFSYVAV